MISAHGRRSIRELTRRRARSFLTIATIAVAIAGLWLFAIPNNIDSALDQRVEADAMHTARLAPMAADLSDEQLAAVVPLIQTHAFSADWIAALKVSNPTGRLR